MLPDSPRYLASVGRKEEARELLNSIRGGRTSQEDIDREYLEIITIAQDSKPSSPIEFVKILIGKGGSQDRTWAAAHGCVFGFRLWPPGLVSL